MKLSGTITKVSGPLVVANGLADANVSDVVRVGEQRLIGEILNMTGDSFSASVDNFSSARAWRSVSPPSRMAFRTWGEWRRIRSLLATAL